MKTLVIEDQESSSKLYTNDNNIIIKSAAAYKFMVGWAIEDVLHHCKIHDLQCTITEGQS